MHRLSRCVFVKMHIVVDVGVCFNFSDVVHPESLTNVLRCPGELADRVCHCSGVHGLFKKIHVMSCNRRDCLVCSRALASWREACHFARVRVRLWLCQRQSGSSASAPAAAVFSEAFHACPIQGGALLALPSTDTTYADIACESEIYASCTSCACWQITVGAIGSRILRLRHVCRDFLPCLTDHGPMVLGVAACGPDWPSLRASLV